MIQGINHVTLTVKDLDRDFIFYTETLGFRPLAKRKNKSAYMLAGDSWVALVLDKDKDASATVKSYAHIAFSVSNADFNSASERIRGSGVKIWQDNSSPGESLYFSDPSGNRLEIHASDWRDRIAWLKKNPSPDVEVFE